MDPGSILLGVALVCLLPSLMLTLGFASATDRRVGLAEFSAAWVMLYGVVAAFAILTLLAGAGLALIAGSLS